MGRSRSDDPIQASLTSPYRAASSQDLPLSPLQKDLQPYKIKPDILLPQAYLEHANGSIQSEEEKGGPIMFTTDEIKFLTRHNLEVIITTGLQANISGTQIRTWVDEILINEIDHYPQESKGTLS